MRIVTCILCLLAGDVRGTPATDVLRPEGVICIEHAFDLSPAVVCKAVRDQRASLKNPPKSVQELFDTYLQQGLATTVCALRDHAGLL